MPQNNNIIYLLPLRQKTLDSSVVSRCYNGRHGFPDTQNRNKMGRVKELSEKKREEGKEKWERRGRKREIQRSEVW